MQGATFPGHAKLAQNGTNPPPFASDAQLLGGELHSLSTARAPEIEWSVCVGRAVRQRIIGPLTASFRRQADVGRAVPRPIRRGHSAMTAIAFYREPPRALCRFRIRNWALGTNDRGGQDKSRKVRPVGRSRCVRNFKRAADLASVASNLRIPATPRRHSASGTLRRPA